MTTSALASLTATYTDSEAEDDDVEKIQNADETTSKTTKSPLDSDSKSMSSSRPASPSGSLSSVTITTRFAKLVSYHDDTVASEEEGDIVNHQIIYLNDDQKSEDNSGESIQVRDGDHLIPPEPPGNCAADLQENITKLYERMQAKQMDINTMIQNRKDFRNPSIYEKLVQFCDLNESGTNYPPNIYDPLKWSKESFYEDLAAVQVAEMAKREKEHRGKAELIQGTKRLEEDNRNKRKSKWDMPGGGAVKVNQPGLVAPPTLTSSATGTKSTVISAFGSLPKKPKL